MSMDPSKQEDLQHENISAARKVKIENFNDDSREDFPCQVIDLPMIEHILKEEERDEVESGDGNQSEEPIENHPERSGDGNDMKRQTIMKPSTEVLHEADEKDGTAIKKEPIEAIFFKAENLSEDIKYEPSDALDETKEHCDNGSNSLEESRDIVKETDVELKKDFSVREVRDANGKKISRSIISNMRNLLEKKINCDQSDKSNETIEHVDIASNSSKESNDIIEQQPKVKRRKISRLPFPDYDGKSRTSDAYIKLYSGSTLTNMAFIANERAAKAKRADQKPKVAESIKLNILEVAKANFIGGEATTQSTKKEIIKTESDKVPPKEKVPPVSPILSNLNDPDALVKAFLDTCVPSLRKKARKLKN